MQDWTFIYSNQTRSRQDRSTEESSSGSSEWWHYEKDIRFLPIPSRLFVSLSLDDLFVQDEHDELPTSPSSPSESGRTEMRPTEQDESVMMTLTEIESICLKLRDVVNVEHVRHIDLMEAVIRPSLITPRTKVH